MDEKKILRKKHTSLICFVWKRGEKIAKKTGDDH